MQRNRVVTAVTAAALTVGALAACADDGSDNDQVTITILEFQESRAESVEQFLPEFEKEMAAQGKDIEVELITDILTDDQFKTKITQQLLSGKAPDVIDMGGSNVPGLAGAGYLLKLDDYLDDWDGWNDFYPSVKDQIRQADGHYYSLPHEAGVQSLFYRKDVFEELGIDTSQPQTWDELIERLKAVKAETGEPPIVIPTGTAWGAGTWSEGFLPIAAGTGSTFYDPETAKWNVESEGLTATFNLFDELVNEGLLPVQDLLNPNPWEPTKYEDFPEGTMTVAAQGSWGWRFDWGPEGAAPIDDLYDKVATWDYPSLVPGTEPYSISGGGFGYSVSAESDHPDAAVELAQWLSSGEVLAEQLADVGSSSPRSGISEIEPYASQEKLLEAERKLPDAVAPPEGEGADRVSQAVQNATGLLLTDDADGDGAAAEFAADAADLLGTELVQQ